MCVWGGVPNDQQGATLLAPKEVKIHFSDEFIECVNYGETDKVRDAFQSGFVCSATGLIANHIWFKKQDLLLSILLLQFTFVLVKYHLSIPTQRSRVCYKCLCVYLPRPFYRGCNECWLVLTCVDLGQPSILEYILRKTQKQQCEHPKLWLKFRNVTVSVTKSKISRSFI